MELSTYRIPRVVVDVHDVHDHPNAAKIVVGKAYATVLDTSCKSCYSYQTTVSRLFTGPHQCRALESWRLTVLIPGASASVICQTSCCAF